MVKASNKLIKLKALEKQDDKSLQYLIDEACRILNSPLILYDIDYKVLAYAQTESNGGAFWDWFIENGVIRHGIIDTYIFEGLLENIINTKKPIFISNDKLRYDWLYGKIFDNDNMPIACIHIMATKNAFSEDDLEAVGALCKVFSNELVKIPYYQNFAQSRFEYCVTMLITNSIENAKEKSYNASYVDLAYAGLKENLYLSVADISQCDPSYSRLNYYRDLFKQVQPAFKYSIYSNYIIIIMSTDAKNFYPKKSFGKLNNLFVQEKISIGVSSRFENFFELSQYYNEAVSALLSGLKDSCDQSIFVYGA